MTVVAAKLDEPVQAELPISAYDVHADENLPSPCGEEPSPSDAAGDGDVDLLRGLGALAALVANASETLNQCLLTIERRLSAASIAREEWVPIRAARSCIERAPAPDDRRRTQERVFGGVPVMILQMSAPVTTPGQPAKRCEWLYELGYAVAGDDWALVIRTASFDATNEGDPTPQYSDHVPLRDAPLELRLKAVLDLPVLFEALEVTTLDVEIPVAMECAVPDDLAQLPAGNDRAPESH